MSADLASSSCPLCKRPVEGQQSTRLCPQCQSMVQTIAPRDSGGLTGVESERRREEPVRPEPGPADIKFDLGSMGAMPAGIPVEPTTLQFEATEGFGDIFGAMPTAAADLELEQTPFTPETADRSRTAFVESQPASPPSLPEVNDITRHD